MQLDAITIMRNLELYKPRDVMKIFGVCHKTLYRWDKSGKFKSRRNENNRRYYLKSDIEDFISRNTKQ